MSTSALFFDQQDRELLALVNAILDKKSVRSERGRSMYAGVLHPHGIIEMATTHEQRVAYAVINLLGSLEIGQSKDRLAALKALHDEVLHSARTTFRYNTGRVLIQIMKEIVRTRDNEELQLRLAHEFRQAAAGNPRVVRVFLKRYHLLEMPETWDQLAMDHHVHDANTKGRKNPTHLIMDAWIKGIRFLTLIYYNYVSPEAAQEAMEAAKIMGITLRVGLEFRSTYKKRFISIVWVPKGFSEADSFLSFIAEPRVNYLLQEGRKASAWVEAHVLQTLEKWNSVHRLAMNKELGINVQPLDPQDFLRFVGAGQTSFLHLAEMLHRHIYPELKKRYDVLEVQLAEHHLAREGRDAKAWQAEEKAISSQKSYINGLTAEMLLNFWLKAEANTDLPSSREPHEDDALPEILSLTPEVLIGWLMSLRGASDVWLNLAGIDPVEVLEILWDCQGMISHLETFNLKDWQEGKTPYLEEISEIQTAINEGSALHLKQIIRAMLAERLNATAPDVVATCDKLKTILRNIVKFQAPYRVAPLRSRIGTDSTSHSSMRHGMGLVVPATLPRKTQRLLAKEKGSLRMRLPLKVNIFQRVSYFSQNNLWGEELVDLLRRIPGFKRFGLKKRWEWVIKDDTAKITKDGNVITMGGIALQTDNGFAASSIANKKASSWPGMAYLNTTFSNVLKVLFSFIAATLSFIYTQDWYVLAWFGALIWYGITTFRNVLQAIISGGGFRGTSLLRWNDYVSWTRIADSLMYTGISVVLLEVLIRKMLLQDTLGLTVGNNPVLVFTIISIANGFYISAHNIYRGFPIEAVVGNGFRSILAIPLTIIYNKGAFLLLISMGVPDPIAFLQPGAAILSKTASDTVACVIESIADKRNNLRLRFWDFKTKLEQLYNNYTMLEIAYPDHDVLKLLSQPKDLLELTQKDHKHLQAAVIIDALDLMYFWMYLPLAQQALKRILRTLPHEDCLLLAQSQFVLTRVREVSQLFVDGIVGKHFSKALAFYLDRHDEYILALDKACGVTPEEVEKRIEAGG